MAAPTKTQIQMLIVNKIHANAVSSSKTLGADVKDIYSRLLNKIYGTTIPLPTIQTAINEDIKANSVNGVRITGNRLKRYFDNLTFLAYSPFNQLPPRETAEDALYPHLTYYSTRTNVTIGSTLRDITKLMLDKIYDGTITEPETNNAFTYTFPFNLA